MIDTLQYKSIKYLKKDATNYLSCPDELGNKSPKEIYDELQEGGYFEHQDDNISRRMIDDYWDYISLSLYLIYSH